MLRALLKTMRPKQWLKNAIVMAAVVFDRQLGNSEAVLRSFAGLMLFCMISSSVYIINDVVDAEADRLHPRKKNRPVASGELRASTAVAASVVISVFSLMISFILSVQFGIILTIYLVLNLAYSFGLKHVPLIDVLVIATGFVLRVGGGVSLITVERFSPWLYVVTTLLALYIGFGKRRAELSLVNGTANSQRPVLNGYSIPFLDQLIVIVSSTTIVAYSLYTFSAPNLPENHSMMLTIPFVLYGIFRYLYLIQIKGEGGAPDELLLTDRPLQITIVLWGIAILIIFYVF